MSPSFNQFNFPEPLYKALAEMGYTQPTPIQIQAIPAVLEKKDIIGCAQTGTGKTAAFGLPVLTFAYERKHSYTPKNVDTLILTPTRELAVQIYQNFENYAKHTRIRLVVAYGGVSIGPQARALQSGADVLIATPGRMLDLIMQRKLSLQTVKTFILDEADRMLDMGFIHEIKKIVGMLPHQRQTLLFSATMPQEIQKLASTLLKNPVKVEVAPESTTAEKIEQKVFYVEQSQKKELLVHLLKTMSERKVIVFARMKHGANRLAEYLCKNKIPAQAIHGDKSQNNRLKTLEDFKSGDQKVLIATDVVSRGIDIDDVTHVINFDVPHMAESYVHRIGRTARAGRSGIAYSFCNAEEKSFIKDIEKTIRQNIPVERQHPFHSDEIEKAVLVSKGKAKALIEKGFTQIQGNARLNIGFGSKKLKHSAKKKRQR